MNISAAEVVIVLIIALLVFGPKRLPDLARQVGRGVREFRGHMSAMSDHVADIDTDRPARPPTSPAAPSTDAPGVGLESTPTASPDDDDDILDGVVVAGGTPPGPERT